MRVLITGAAGFVGQHLADLCSSQGATVVGVGRRPHVSWSLPESIESYLPVELLDPGETEQALISAKPDRVFHLAAEASVAGSWQDPAKVMTDNVNSTFNLLEGVRRHFPQARVLVAGSGEEYGPPAKLPIDETQLPRPQNPYAVSKAAAGLTAGFYADAYDLAIVRTRAFNHAGPGQNPTYVVASFANQIAEAEASGAGNVEVVTGNLGARRDFTDVRDVVRAYWMALESCRPDLYNVASGKAVSIQQILDGLAQCSTIDVNHRVDPKLMRPNEVPEIVGSPQRLHEQCGWQPQLDLRQTLSDTLEWWRETMASGTGQGVNS